MGHLDELYAKYRDKGLIVLGVTDEDASKVEKFIADTGATHPIVIESSDSSTEYGIRGFPSSFLIDAGGKVAWTGHPGSLKEEDIERLLQEVRLVPDLPKVFSGAAKDLEKGDFAGARKFLSGKLESGRLTDEERAKGEETVKWIDDRGASLLDSAKAAMDKGDFYEASQTLDRVADGFKGLEVGDKARETLDGILKDKDRKREVDAGKQLDAARERARKLKPEQAAMMYHSVAKKFEGTKAAEKAMELAKQAEAAARK